uniref:Uncharacterized protein n=1 Tax=Amphimedon queenslandica TaxID=400682 RepID=A0A1X7URK2_AMPQE
MIPQAKDQFSDLGIKITTSYRFLGGVVGDSSGCDIFVNDKAQAEYAAYTKSLQNDWIFYSSLPLKLGGLNIRNIVTTATAHYTASRSATKILINAITGSTSFSPYDHVCQVLIARQHHSLSQSEADNTLFTNTLTQLDTNYQRTITRARDSLSLWLNVLPTVRDNFDLSPNEFMDVLCLRYAKPLLNLPHSCDGRGSAFTTSHALDCRKGGLVTLRHNEIRDVLHDVFSMAWSHVIKDPLVTEAQSDSEALVCDISIAWSLAVPVYLYI